MTSHLPFADRRQAGRLLARRLAATAPRAPVVLALPRGGVPVAAEVSAALGAPLDLVIVRKIGVPFQPELAAGAVIDGDAPEVVVNEDVAHALGFDRADLERLARPELEELERRRATYGAGRTPQPLAGRTAILVDDGLATGASMRAAVLAARRRAAARIVVAVPVAPPDTVAALRSVADDVVCLESPEPFHGIGAFYRDFHQVPDEEVLEALRTADRTSPPASPGPADPAG